MRYRIMILLMLCGVMVFAFSEEATSTVSDSIATPTVSATQAVQLSFKELLERKREAQLELLKLNEMIDEYIRSALGTTVEIQDILADIRGNLEDVWKMYENLKLETATSIKQLEDALENLNGKIKELNARLSDLEKQLGEKLTGLDRKFEELNARLSELDKKASRPQLWDFLILGVAAIALVLPFVVR